MIKISIHEPLPHSAVSYYRSIGTFSYLPKKNDKIQISIPGQISWNNLIGTDIFYMERPQQDNDLQALQLAKDFNIKVWVDYDDCLHEIPQYNPAYKFYKKTSVLKNIEKAMTMADIITVSTPTLKEYYKKYNENIYVIENAHNDYQYKFKKKDETFQSINWRGSATHRSDLLSVSENIFNLAKKYKNWAWTFVGNDLWYITEKIKCFNIQECDIIDYYKFIKDLKSAIQIVPLVHNQFNQCKSNIGWIEGTYAGSTCICPTLPEFEKPGIVNYNFEKENSFGYYLEKTISNNSFRKKKYIESYNYIKENLLLSKINSKRLEIIERLLDNA